MSNSSNFRIGYFGDGPWAHNSLDLLLKDRGIDIVFICGRFTTKDKILKKKANENGIVFLNVEDINSSKFYSYVEKLNIDLFVSMSFDQIFKEKLYKLPKFNTINCHAGKLPFYRGRNVLNWVLINDEKEFGITVHYIDKGIDTGDIILQRSFEITDKDDYKSLLNKAYKHCPNILKESIDLIINKGVFSIQQRSISENGLICARRIEGDEIINWENNSRTIFNFVRALTPPGPSAVSYCQGKKIKIKKVELVENSPNYIGVEGSILDKNNEEIIVKTKDSYIKIKSWEGDVNLRIGMRFTKK